MLAEHARAWAEQTGMPASVALAQFSDQHALEPYLASLPRMFAPTYAGSWIDDRVVHLLFEGAVPPEARSRIPTSLQILRVELTADNGFNLREVYALQDQVVALLRNSGVEKSFIAFDQPTGTLEVMLGENANPPPALVSLRDQPGLPVPLRIESYP